MKVNRPCLDHLVYLTLMTNCQRLRSPTGSFCTTQVHLLFIPCCEILEDITLGPLGLVKTKYAKSGMLVYIALI
jgi:hypothetical protein